MNETHTFHKTKAQMLFILDEGVYVEQQAILQLIFYFPGM